MSRYQSNSSSRRRAQDVLALPRGFISIRELLDDNHGLGQTVSVIGVVKDYKLPIPTKGSDYKSSLTLYDMSTQGDAKGIDLNVFRQKEEEMPTVEAGDIVVAYTAKHQMFGGSSSLLTSYRTDIHVYEASQIPRLGSSRSASGALRRSSRHVNRKPGDTEHEYVTWLYDSIDKQYIPAQEDFSARAELSMNVRDRFSLLAHVQDRMFADLIVQVVRQPFDLRDKVCLWASDWTENASFFHKTDDSPDWTDGMPVRDGDPYGYTSKFKKPTDPGGADGKWRGPLGKRSIQLTCWEPHADFIRDQVEIGTWVHLRKVQIGYGHNSSNLEGFLRGEKEYSTFSDKIKVQILDPQADSEKIDSRLRDAIRRKRDYEKERDHSKGGSKRKAEEPLPKDNTKARRAAKRAARQKAVEEVEAKESKEQFIPDLNDLVKCENPDTNPRPLSSILEPVVYHTTIDNEPVSLELPFTCAKDRTHARVVDFHPSSLEEFAVSRRRTDNDCLSDNSADDIDPDSDEDGENGTGRPGRNRVWEWRFALKLEEATPALAKKDRTPVTVWVHVGNPEAQLLTDIDAQDLRAPDAEEPLGRLREQMFKLWGDLEERKVDLEERKRERRDRILRNMPPPSSGAGGDEAHEDAVGCSPGLGQISNKPFVCCIQQYGVRVEAGEAGEDNAGDGKRWQRMFGLFGTKIASD